MKLFGLKVPRDETVKNMQLSVQRQIKEQVNNIVQVKDIEIRLAPLETRVEKMEKQIEFAKKTGLKITGAAFAFLIGVIGYFIKKYNFF